MPVVELLPVGNGAFSTWTASPAGTPHWRAVFDPVAADDDATFVRSDDDTQKVETFLYETGRLSPRVRPVSWIGLKARVRRTALGFAENVRFAPRVYSSGIAAQGSTIILPRATTAWNNYGPEAIAAWRFFLDPATGRPWTDAAALSAELGMVDLTFDEGAGAQHDLRWTLARKVMNVNYWDRPAVRGGDHGAGQ